MINLESRLERYKSHKINKRQKRIKIIAFILSIFIFITGMGIVDRTAREMMCIYDKQLCSFSYDDEFYKLHLFGKDYLVEKKEIDDKIYNAKVIVEDFAKLANNYFKKILAK